MRHPSPLHPIHHRRHGLPLLAMAVLFALATLLWFEPWRGNGYAPVFHGTLFASLYTDGDLDLMNEYLMSSNPLKIVEEAARSMTSEGYVTDALPIGPTLLSAPFWLVAHALANWISPETPFDPVAPVYTFAFSFAGLFYGFLGFLLLWRVAYRFFPSWLAFAAAVAAFFGSPAAEVCFKICWLSYIYSFFTVALFLYATTECARRPCLRRVVYLALAAGLMVITYWEAVVFLILPAAVLLWPGCVRPLRRSSAEAETEEKEPDPAPTIPNVDFVPPLDEASLAVSPPAPPEKAERRASLLSLLVRGVVFLVVFLLALSPQFLVWDKVFGDWPFSRRFMMYPDLSFGSWTQWKRLMLGADGGLLGGSLLRSYPIVSLSLIGLLVMALRRNAAGVAAFLSVVLFSVVDNLAWEWQWIESTRSIRYALLVPFVAIGLAQFCDVMRSRGSRFLAAVFMMGLACWTIIVATARRCAFFYASAGVDPSDAWPLVLPEMLRHPLAFFGDSLLIRYVSQGTPRLESLVFLLFVVLLIPSATWLALRYALPLVRRWSLMKALALGTLVFVLAFDALVSRSDLPLERLLANLALSRRLLEDYSPSVNDETPIGDAAQTSASSNAELTSCTLDLRGVLDLYPGHTATELLLARDERTRGDVAGARDLYRRLAQRSFRAGELGLLETARTQEETLEALNLLARREQGDLWIALSIVEKYWATGQKERARDYLDRVFPPSMMYWRCRAEMTPDDPVLALQYLKRALSYTPMDTVLRKQIEAEEKKQRGAAK